MPTIWRSRVLSTSDFMQPFYLRNADGSHVAVELVDARMTFRKVDPEHRPGLLQQHEDASNFNQSYSDAFKAGGFFFLSTALRDVLSEFDLGATWMLELPVYKDLNKTPSQFPPFHLLHVCETKEGFLPEQSTGIRQLRALGKPIPGAPYQFLGWEKGEEVAVSTASVPGVDLWGYDMLRGQLFFSDRLKRAIDAAGLRTKAFGFQKVIVLS